jgi:O-antigen/teichoic acid export membrane protein
VTSDALARDATRGSVVKLLAEIVGRGLQLATTLLLMRGLGPAEFGVFGALSALAVVAAEASDLGLQGTAGRALVAGTFSLRGILRAKAWLSVGFVVGALFVWPFSPVLAPLLLYFGGAGWAEILGVVLRARGRRREEAWVIVGLRLSGLLLVAIPLGQGGGAQSCAWALAASTVLPGLFAAWRVSLARGPAGTKTRELGTRRILAASGPLAVNGGLALLSVRVEVFVMSALAAPAELGFFVAALQFVQVLNFVPSALMAGAMPALTREAMHASGLEGDAVRRRTAATVAFAAVPATAGLVLVAPALVRDLLGEAYLAAGPILAVAGFGVLPLFLNGIYTHALIAAERASWLPRLTLLRVVLAALLAAALVPAAGGRGAALGFVVSEWVLVVLGARAVREAGFAVQVLRPVGLAALAALPMGVAVWPMRGNLPLALLVGVAVFALVTALLWRSPRLRHDLGYS